MRSKRKHNLYMLGLTGLAGTALLTAGSFALISSGGLSPSETFAAGTVQIKVWDGDDCVGPDWSTAPQNLAVDYFYPGKARSETFTVQNTGTLDEWIGIMSHLPSSVPLDVEYSIQVYQPDTDDGDTNDPDANGDIHSHCHTGSKGRGAGGEDKGGSDQTETNAPWNQYSVGWFNTADTTPQMPFELPVGYHAHITYTYKLDNSADKKFENKSDPLTFDVWAVQYQNNKDSTGQKPISWAPQKPSP